MYISPLSACSPQYPISAVGVESPPPFLYSISLQVTEPEENTASPHAVA